MSTYYRLYDDDALTRLSFVARLRRRLATDGPCSEDCACAALVGALACPEVS